jgi:uroporphyrinogen-III synthase
VDPRNRIVVTRDRVRAEPLATRLAPRGVDVVAMAVTETAPPGLPSWQALVEAVGRGHDHIAVASGNAAEALVRAVAEAKRELPEVVAVGAITVGVLARHGIAAIAAARADSVGLAEELIERGARLVLWPRSDQGREEGLARLVEAGIAFEAPVAYRTITRAADAPGIAEGLAALADAAAVCVYAPSQAVALDALVAGGLAGLRAPLIAIGETTAAAVTARGGRVASIAASPDPDAMASAVLAVLSQEP